MANTFRNCLPKGSQAIKDVALRVLCHESFQTGEIAAPSRGGVQMIPKFLSLQRVLAFVS
jgi:hypothetical protein